MNTRICSVMPAAVLAASLAGCASTYAPPPEKRGDSGCPPGEVWICESHVPTRIDSVDRDLVCRCDELARIH